MNDYRSILFWTSLAFMLVVSACTNVDTSAKEEEKSTNIIEITTSQFMEEGMEWVSIEKHQFQESIKTTGSIQLAPQALASIYSSVSGIIKKVSVNLNSEVSKDQELCIIESIEFVKMQQEYLESKALFRSTETDYLRIKSLFEKKVTSEKEFVLIESQYMVLKAKTQSLKAQLKILNIDFVQLEKGELSNYLIIRSPLHGYVSELPINRGQYISSESQLMRIIDMKGAQVHFPVYSQYLEFVSPEQKISFYASNSRAEKYNSKISSIGKLMHNDLQAANCIAPLPGEAQPSFLPGMRVNVEIITNEIEALAVPNQAIINSDQKYYVLLKKPEKQELFQLEKVRVQVGRIGPDYTEVRGIEQGMVLSKGSYYFQTQE